MKRRLFNLLAGMSLLLALSVVWLALPHGRAVYMLFHRSGNGSYQLLQFYPGEIGVGVSNETALALFDGGAPPPAPMAWGYRGGSTFGAWPPGSAWNALGFSYWPSDAMRIVNEGSGVSAPVPAPAELPKNLSFAESLCRPDVW